MFKETNKTNEGKILIEVNKRKLINLHINL